MPIHTFQRRADGTKYNFRVGVFAIYLLRAKK